MEIHRSAHKHGINDTAIRHALECAVTVFDLEPDPDPPRVLAIGPDPAGNLLEIVWLELEDVNLGDPRDAATPSVLRPVATAPEDMP